MKLQKLSLSWSQYTDADFENKAEYILASMTANANFTDPIPTLAVLGTAVTNYSQSLVAAADLGRTSVANKNKNRSILEGLLTQLGMYVMYIANGDVAILVSSGFTLTKERQSRVLGKPGSVTLSSGNTSGQMVSSITGDRAAINYLHEIATEPPTENTVWQSFPSSRAKFVFTQLQPGKQYWVRVAALGSGDQRNYSPVATQFGQ